MPVTDISTILKAPVIPVLTIERVADAVPLARALCAGGLPVIEVTLRTPVALKAARAIANEVPEAVLGIGTVTHAAQIADAIAAGARFLVSPGTSPALADALAQASVLALPGCATVSEAIALAERGFALLKFFPAEGSGGARWLKWVSEPLPNLLFCPTGGLTLENAPSYLALPNVPVVGGTWPAPRAAIAAGDFARITELAREAAKLKS
ncbi:MAG TPA: bifunctional 4-hydroxy-2-oxoglutarate aldolase/2-dehydro-3-deoxy-phosphogluconate aldolase [Xanthobacteraceae bacterium]|jgi:2-dehydro-3-deoxyphosphogluconate aldolase/(4S)-4-hydroxy-2-oxoglutarate aldolase